MRVNNAIRNLFKLAVLSLAALCWTGTATAADTSLDADVHAALDHLYKTTPAAKALGQTAKGILVFPNITKAGFIVGAQYGEGAGIQGGKITGYYSISAASYGLQAGVQSFGYVIFLMTDEAIEHVRSTGGFDLGSAPSVVIVDEGMAGGMSAATMKEAIYAFTFGQQGLMAGLGLQGTKITKLNN